MPVPPWRFAPGDVAYVRPCTPDRKVTLIREVPFAPQGFVSPHWVVRNAAGDECTVAQIELSSRPCSLRKDGTVKLLQEAL
jgi:hypothetical protein